MKKKKYMVSALLATLVLIASSFFYLEYVKNDSFYQNNDILIMEASLDMEEDIVEIDELNDQDPNDTLPHDKLFITPERQKYVSEEMTLIIPKLNQVLEVYNGVDDATLLKGVGLYDYAQLPGKGNRNVSIAGHRNGLRKGVVTDSAPFYYIDTVLEGDYLYLTYKENIYRYKWHSMNIVAIDDWGPIYSQGFSCLTLTTCHPIGISTERLILRAKLDAIFPYSSDFDYLVSEKE